MSGVGLTLTVQNDQVLAGLRSVEAFGQDPAELLARIGAYGESSTRERFSTNVAPDGTPWTPSQRALATGGVTLTLSGHLRDSINYQVDGSDAVEWGSNKVYAAIHQVGFEGDVNVPAHSRRFTMVFGRPLTGTAEVRAHTRHQVVPVRAYLGLSDADQTEVLAITADHVMSLPGMDA